MSVEHIVLEEEDQIEEYGDHWEHELHNVKSSSTKRVLSLTNCVKEYLEHGEASSSEVKNHIGEGPTNCTFSLPIPVDLLFEFKEGQLLLEAYT